MKRTCKKCRCEDYCEYKDLSTGKWIRECQNCSEILRTEEDWEVEE